MLCAANKVRSVSSVARLAIENMLQGENALPEAQLRIEIWKLDNKIAVLDRRVEDIAQRLGK
jgi:hypothetical protein